MKAQVSIEFIVLVSVLLLIFIAFLLSSSSLKFRLIGIKSDTEAKELCDDIASEINHAVRAGNGYERRFHVEDSFYGVSNFDISIEGNSVFIDWNKKSVSSMIITNNVVGDVSKGWNKINNTNGVIYVN